MPRAGILALLSALVLACGVASTAQAYPHGTRVLVAFLPNTGHNPSIPAEKAKKLAPITEVFYKRLQNRPSLSLGLLNPTQGSYSSRQALLDYTQGTRVSGSTYKPSQPYRLKLIRIAGKRDASNFGTSRGYILRWGPTLARAMTAPGEIFPGLLASNIPGGAAYAGVLPAKSGNVEAVMAADKTGHIPEVSIGGRTDVATRAQALLKRYRLVVAGLPPKRAGGRALDQLIAKRAQDELLIVVQTPPDAHVTQLLGIGAIGLGDSRSLTSATTRRSNMVAGIDFVPTILQYLGIKVPDTVTGQPFTITGTRPTAKQLDSFRQRLTDIGKRRIPTLEFVILLWIGVLLAFGALGGWYATRRRALRLGSLATMWIPVMVLFTAIVQPSSGVREAAIVALGCFMLAALTDKLLAWPRGPMLPAAVTLGAFTIDMFRNSNVLVRSLIGPNPRFGSRFYGVGNELEIILTIVFLIGVAAALSYAVRSRRNAAVFAGAGFVFGVVICSGRLGADVGGVFTVGSGVAVATLLMLPGRPSRRAIVLTVLTPIAALGLLAVIDLASGGNGHFTRSVLHAHSWNELSDTIKRRNQLAWGNLTRGRTPAIVLAGLVAVSFAARNRRWLLAPLEVPAWRAALMGSLAAAIVGSITNDSGALIFIIGIFVLTFVVAYVQGDPRLAGGSQEHPDFKPTKLGRRLAEDPSRVGRLPAIDAKSEPGPSPGAPVPAGVS